jgi:hypothetical protein
LDQEGETMTRRFLVLLMAAPVFAQTLPSAESIIERYVTVTGGREARAGHTTEIIRGTVEFAAMGLKGKVARYIAQNGDYFASIEMPGIGAMNSGMKGGVAWQDSLLTGPRIVTGAEANEALKDATIDLELHWKEIYSKAQTVGEDDVNGELCYRVEMTPMVGIVETWFFAKASGLIVKTSSVAITQQGDIPVETLFSENRAFNGVTRAAKQTQKAAGQEIVLTIESVEDNTPIPATQFDLPTSVAALLAARK